jgi:hypothetical protein
MSIKHGTSTAYAHNGCRCDECRAYQNGRVRASRAKRLAEGRVNHGTAGWDDGCRCETCTHAHRSRYADYYQRVAARREATS